MLFASELVNYLFKFVILMAIAVVGVICGAKIKKSKIDKETQMTNTTSDEE